MAGDDDHATVVPQWKRELISRRRAAARHVASSVQFTCPPTVASVRHPPVSAGRCQSSADVSGESSSPSSSSSCGDKTAMRLEPDSDVRRSTHSMDAVGYRLIMGEQKNKTRPRLVSDTNGGGGGDSSGSEELAYGPGIVKRLKSKYLSMTLRENKARGVRPSTQNMRRAASLEHLVDASSPKQEAVAEETRITRITTTTEIRPRFARRQDAVAGGNPRFRADRRGNESVKRARSVEALLRCDRVVVEETRVVVVEKSAVAVTPVETKPPKQMNGLPAASVVRTTLRLFETRGVGKAAPSPSDRPSPSPSNRPSPSPSNKPSPSPKPSPEKLRRAPRPLSPVTVEVRELPARAPDPKPVAAVTKGDASRTRRPPPVSPFHRPHSPVARQTSLVAKQPSPLSPVAKQPSPLSPVAKQPSPLSPVAKQPSPVSPVAKQPSPVSPVAKQPSPVSPVAKLPSPLSPVAKPPSPISPVAKQPSPLSPVAKERTPSPVKASLVTNGNEVVDGVVQKAVSLSALDAIRKAGHRVELSFKTSESKSHLPGGAVCSATAPDVPGASKGPSVVIVPKVPSASNVSKGPSVAIVPKVPSASNVSKGPSVAIVPKVSNVSPGPKVEIVEKVATVEIVPSVSKGPCVAIVPEMPSAPNVSKGPNAENVPEMPSAPNVSKLPSAVAKATPVSFPEKRPPMSPLPELTSPDGRKQVATIRPILAQTSTSAPPARPTGARPTAAEAKKNRINSGKRETAAIVDGNARAESPRNVAGSGGPWDGGGTRPWNRPLTTVEYDFRGRKEVPSHVQNDGMVLPRTRTKIRPGESGYILLHPSLQESSADGQELDDFDVIGGFAGPPSPCNVVFEGDNVLINGRSNLRTRPRQSKLRITFDDDALQLFEYPSESSLLSDPTPSAPAPSGAAPTAPATGTPLASYTSKTALGDFELGVTRTTPTPRPREATPPEEAATTTEENNVAWSHTANDHLMF